MSCSISLPALLKQACHDLNRTPGYPNSAEKAAMSESHEVAARAAMADPLFLARFEAGERAMDWRPGRMPADEVGLQTEAA